MTFKSKIGCFMNSLACRVVAQRSEIAAAVVVVVVAADKCIPEWLVAVWIDKSQVKSNW